MALSLWGFDKVLSGTSAPSSGGEEERISDQTGVTPESKAGFIRRAPAQETQVQTQHQKKEQELSYRYREEHSQIRSL